ncbi:hypothetical protein GSI_04549 [Ganoderma sinense ZZ0214-1]|uniref:XPG-I domain-containing protein n=1 Tax=Ganoderma sinense ZZ0214-1 TaxID=1077348 RepID=A0A2G8SH49_9APHY|nr:hypothetical protein GSI_04549 [Ganoderma sinense ZZ0214-1]
MGVDGLWKTIHDAGRTVNLETLTIKEGFEGRRRKGRMYCVGIDVSLWMRELQPMSAGTAALRAFLSRLCFLSQYPVHAIFVVDGPLLPRMKRDKQARAMPCWMTAAMRDFARAFGFEWLEAAAEAGAELANMNDYGAIDAVLTDDSDALLFGASVVIQNPSFKSADRPTYVEVYRADIILRDTEMGRGDLLLFALLVGNGYDPNGLPRCSASTARGVIQYGLGQNLYAAMLAYDDDDPELIRTLRKWRARLQSVLEQDPSGFIGRAQPLLAAAVPSSFPDLNVVRLLMFPTVLKHEFYKPLTQPRLLNVARIGALCERYFTFGSATSIKTTLRRTVWRGEVVRMLVQEGVQPATRRLLDIAFIKVDEPPGAGFAGCHLRVTDAGFHEAATAALCGSRKFTVRAGKTEEEAIKEAFQPLVITVPAVIVERARPTLVNPAFNEVGYMYGHVHAPLASGKPIYTAPPGSVVIPESLDPVLDDVGATGPLKTAGAGAMDLADDV